MRPTVQVSACKSNGRVLRPIHIPNITRLDRPRYDRIKYCITYIIMRIFTLAGLKMTRGVQIKNNLSSRIFRLILLRCIQSSEEATYTALAHQSVPT